MKLHRNSRVHTDTNYRKKFGIGLVQYETLLSQQDNKCKICKKIDWRNLAVDHDHKTGNVRGLLCSVCNTGLGQFQDDVELLQNAIDYLNNPCIMIDDVIVERVDQRDKPRWRNIVTTPDGVFYSFDQAGKHFNVHPTTVGGWCGAYKGQRRREFSFERKFCSLNEAINEFN